LRVIPREHPLTILSNGEEPSAADPEDYIGAEPMQKYPPAYTSAENVAETVYAAATDGRDKLRYSAGADSKMLAELRKSLPGSDPPDAKPITFFKVLPRLRTLRFVGR
jgi:hypothetical protein